MVFFFRAWMVQYPAEYNITYNTIKVFYPENEKPGGVGVTGPTHGKIYVNVPWCGFRVKHPIPDTFVSGMGIGKLLPVDNVLIYGSVHTISTVWYIYFRRYYTAGRFVSQTNRTCCNESYKRLNDERQKWWDSVLGRQSNKDKEEDIWC